MEPYYIVNTYSTTGNKNTGDFVSGSDVFFSKMEAVEFKKYLDNSNAFVNRVVYCVFLPEKNMETFEVKLTKKLEKKTNFKIYSIKSGYLLKCHNNNVYYGMDKMEEGRWDSVQEGWVFQLDCNLDKLSRLGSFTESEMSLNPSSRYNLRKRTPSR
jgi:hypothetical protein